MSRVHRSRSSSTRTATIELQPVLPIPADQAWFWTERWQAGEREADEDIAAGRVSHAMDVDDFLAHLERARQRVKYDWLDRFAADWARSRTRSEPCSPDW